MLDIEQDDAFFQGFATAVLRMLPAAQARKVVRRAVPDRRVAIG